MSVVILGGTGYLGKKLINELLSKNINIICIVREEPYVSKFSDKINFLTMDNFSSELKKGNIYNIDWFINLACKYQKTFIKDIDILDANFFTPMKFLNIALENNIKKFLTIGTSLPNDFNMYCFSKSKFSEFGKWYAEKINDEKKFLFCEIKLENFYGEDEPKDRFIVNTIIKLKNNEEIFITERFQKRDFIYIEDVIFALTEIITKDLLKIKYVEIPLGTGRSVRIRDLIEYLAKIVNSKSKLNFGAIPMRKNEPDCIADLKILNSLNIKIKYDLELGMKKMLKGVKN